MAVNVSVPSFAPAVRKRAAVPMPPSEVSDSAAPGYGASLGVYQQLANAKQAQRGAGSAAVAPFPPPAAPQPTGLGMDATEPLVATLPRGNVVPKRPSMFPGAAPAPAAPAMTPGNVFAPAQTGGELTTDELYDLNAAELGKASAIAQRNATAMAGQDAAALAPEGPGHAPRISIGQADINDLVQRDRAAADPLAWSHGLVGMPSPPTDQETGAAQPTFSARSARALTEPAPNPADYVTPDNMNPNAGAVRFKADTEKYRTNKAQAQAETGMGTLPTGSEVLQSQTSMANEKTRLAAAAPHVALEDQNLESQIKTRNGKVAPAPPMAKADEMSLADAYSQRRELGKQNQAYQGEAPAATTARLVQVKAQLAALDAKIARLSGGATSSKGGRGAAPPSGKQGEWQDYVAH